MPRIPALSSWQASEDAFAFNPDGLARRPRGWERAPESPHAPRHKGHKVWKRPKPRLNDTLRGLPTDPDTNDDVLSRNALGVVSTNTPRPIKRLRLKNAPGVEGEAKALNAARYLSTLEDDHAGKRRVQQAVQPISCLDEPGHEDFNDTANETSVDGEIDEALSSSVRDRTLTHPQPVQEKPETLGGDRLDYSHAADHHDENEASARVSTASPKPKAWMAEGISETNGHCTGLLASGSALGDIHKAPTRNLSEEISRSEEDHAHSAATDGEQETDRLSDSQYVSTLAMNKTASASTPHIAMDNNMTASSAQSPECGVGSTNTLTNALHYPNLLDSLSLENVLVPESQGVGSPQIGTILLRRESLRRKEGPKKRTSSRRVASPQLKKRDTLQEREILQKFTEATISVQEVHGQPKEHLVSLCGFQADNLKANQDAPGPSSSKIGSCENDSEPRMLDNAQNGYNTTITDVEARHLQNMVEADQARDHSECNNLQVSLMDKECILAADIYDAEQLLGPLIKAEPPFRRPRPGTRFSDDASMLQDFLNRSQARKASRDVTLSVDMPKFPQQSTRQSPRKASELHTRKSQSLRKAKSNISNDLANRAGTPPGKPNSENPAVDGMAEEVTTEPTSCRRSTRTRLPTPAKTPISAPSLIPMRRAEGKDPIKLNRSQAQELSMVTRANTRRNKGQAKPPALALKDLSADSGAEATVAKPRREKAMSKVVAWAENLAAYQDAKDTRDKEEEDPRPRVRRMRGLGGVGALNGTPAAKRTAIALPSPNGTPAPKRRGKVR